MKILKNLKMLKPSMVICMFLSMFIASPTSYSKSKNRNFNKQVISSVVTISAIGILGAILYFFFATQKNDDDKGSADGRILTFLHKIKNNFISSKKKEYPKNLGFLLSDAPPEEKRAFLNQSPKHIRELYIRIILGIKGYSLLHIALRLRESIGSIKNLIENGENVNSVKHKTGETLYHVIVQDLPRRKTLAKLLIQNGAQIISEDWMALLVDEKVLLIHAKISAFLELIKRKNITKIRFLRALLKFIENEDAPIYDKQTAILLLFDMYKNKKVKIFDKKENLEKCLKHLQFNYRFFNEGEFKDIVEYVLENDLRDIYEKSILYTSAIYEKKDIMFKALLRTYNSFSYSNDPEYKKQIKNEMIKIFNHTKKRNPKLHFVLKNIDIVWDYLSNENLTYKGNRECLEPSVVSHIMGFAGVDAFDK